MKDRVIVHRGDEFGTPFEGRFDSTVSAGRVMERSIALNEGNVREVFSYGVRCPIGRAVIYDEDADIDPGLIDLRQAAQSLQRDLSTIIDRNDDRDLSRVLSHYLI